MNDEATLLYLETDDEVTSVVRRLRQADAERVVLVAPGRSRALSSVVALRLLARVAEEVGRGLAVVGDPLTRSLAGEAGLDAYASVDDARNAVAAPAGDAPAKGASIHVVRGRVDDRTQTGPIVVAGSPEWNDADAETRPVEVTPRARSRSRPTAPARRSGRALPLGILLGALAALLIGAGVLATTVLPAATITVVPRSDPLGPVAYELRIDDPEHLSGTATATAPVTATGTYPIQVQASGTVLFRNWNFVPVEVPAGTLVATGEEAGEQAFATQTAIVVPPGDLTSEGFIRAGEEAVGVLAAEVGPAANVGAEAVDTILTRNVAGRLRGFPSNRQPLVVNPEPMTGGADTTGSEITQADVDAARAALLQALDGEVAEALAATGDRIFADLAEPPEPAVEGLDGLVGTRDQPTAEISGTLTYDRLVVEPDEVVRLAEDRFATDRSALPDGQQLLPAATSVQMGEAHREDDTLIVSVSVVGASMPQLDRDEVVQRVQGRSTDEARRAVAELGDVTIELWPSWVGSVPTMDWRIDLTIAGEPRDLPNPSASGSPGP